MLRAACLLFAMMLPYAGAQTKPAADAPSNLLRQISEDAPSQVHHAKAIAEKTSFSRSMRAKRAAVGFAAAKARIRRAALEVKAAAWDEERVGWDEEDEAEAVKAKDTAEDLLRLVNLVINVDVKPKLANASGQSSFVQGESDSDMESFPDFPSKERKPSEELRKATSMVVQARREVKGAVFDVQQGGTDMLVRDEEMHLKEATVTLINTIKQVTAWAQKHLEEDGVVLSTTTSAPMPTSVSAIQPVNQTVEAVPTPVSTTPASKADQAWMNASKAVAGSKPQSLAHASEPLHSVKLHASAVDSPASPNKTARLPKTSQKQQIPVTTTTTHMVAVTAHATPPTTTQKVSAKTEAAAPTTTATAATTMTVSSTTTTTTVSQAAAVPSQTNSKASATVDHIVEALRMAQSELDDATKLIRGDSQVASVVGEVDQAVADLTRKEGQLIARLNQGATAPASVTVVPGKPAAAATAVTTKAPSASKEKRASVERKAEMAHELEQERDELQEEEMEQQQMEQESHEEEEHEMEAAQQHEMARAGAVFLQR